MNPIQSTFRKLEKDIINRILTVPTHERFEQGLCKIPDTEFYSIWREGNKKWNNSYGECPSNYNLLYNRPQQFPVWLDFDFVLAQNIFGQHQFLSPLAKKMQLPLIRIEHTTWMPWWGDTQKQRRESTPSDVTVFISNHSAEAWGFDKNDPSVFIIEHTVDSDLFIPNDSLLQNRILTVANDFVNRDPVLGFKLFRDVTNGLHVCVVGNTPGLSEAASCVDDLVREYQKSSIYLNTAHLSPIPTSMLEAMSCGCCPISVATCAIPDFIVDGENGFLAENAQELRDKLELAINDPDLTKKMGENARQTIIERCNIDRFTREWKEVFEYAKRNTFSK